MPIIEAGTRVITQINLFTVPVGGQEPLIAFLREAASVAREVDGWVSASLHRSLDGTRIVNYAQSADRDAARRVFEHLRAKGLIEGNKALGEAHPGALRGGRHAGTLIGYRRGLAKDRIHLRGCLSYPDLKSGSDACR